MKLKGIIYIKKNNKITLKEQFKKISFAFICLVLTYSIKQIFQIDFSKGLTCDKEIPLTWLEDGTFNAEGPLFPFNAAKSRPISLICFKTLSYWDFFKRQISIFCMGTLQGYILENQFNLNASSIQSFIFLCFIFLSFYLRCYIPLFLRTMCNQFF